MTPTRHDLDDDLEDLSARLHDLADRWEVRPPDGRPDLVPTRSWVPGWLRGGMVPVLAGVVLVALVVAASAWLSTLGTAPQPVPADQAPGLDTGTVVDLLDEVPAQVVGDGPVTITFGDIAGATDMAETERPAVTDDDAVATWLRALSGGPGASSQDGGVVSLPMSLNLTDLAGWDDELGWSLRDVDRFVDVAPGPFVIGEQSDPDGLHPGDRFTVVTGDAATLPPAGGLTDVGDGIARAGTPRAVLTDSTPARRQGGPLFLADRDARRIAASGRDMVEAWLGEGPRLSSDPVLAEVAERIAADGPVSALVTQGSFADDPAENAPLDARDLLTGPFDTVGLSWSRDGEGGARMTAVYHHATPAAAARTAREIPDLWTTGTGMMFGPTPLDDLAEVDSVETDGTNTIVVLRPRGGPAAQRVFRMMESQDLPFRHAADGPTDPTGDATEDVATESGRARGTSRA